MRIVSMDGGVLCLIRHEIDGLIHHIPYGSRSELAESSCRYARHGGELPGSSSLRLSSRLALQQGQSIHNHIVHTGDTS